MILLNSYLFIYFFILLFINYGIYIAQQGTKNWKKAETRVKKHFHIMHSLKNCLPSDKNFFAKSFGRRTISRQNDIATLSTISFLSAI